MYIIICSISLLLIHNAIAKNDDHGPVVDTNFGKIQGYYIDNVAAFTAIPYGGVINGTNRWSNPKFPFPWPGIWDATVEAPGCPQECVLPSPKYTCPSKQDENCLYLNIYTLKNAKLLPVMVFFHGGDFIQGFAGSKLYDGRFLANSTNIIIVTVNYRLSALGFLVYGTGERAITGNYAIKDQRLALEWIKSNIESFGGDPGKITIAGQSAGAISCAVHMTSVKTSGLFHQVILESNPFGVPLRSMKDAKKLGKDFAKALGCGVDNDFECLYSKSYREVTKAAIAVDTKIIDVLKLLEVFLQWTPVVDGEEITDQPLTLFIEGVHADVPLLMGTTSQEGVMFVNEAFSTKLKSIEYDALLLALFPLHYSKIHELYPPVENDNRFIASCMVTDRTFICPTRQAAQGFANRTSRMSPIYLYVFNHSWSFYQAWEPDYGFCKGYSCHASELPYLFNTVSLAGYTFTNNETILANSIMQYWGNFVKYSNPNGDFIKGISWPVYQSLDGFQVMRLKTPNNEIVKDYENIICNILDDVGYNM